MANYNKDTKFYWLQLKEDFFENDAIEWLEEQKPNGRDYAYFYLKLCLKSLKSNGVLIRKVGNILIPYDNQKLAELTRMDFDTVTVAMELLKQIGLVQILENGEIYIDQLENLIGSKSIGAFKKQQQRLLKGGQGVDKCPPKIEIEKEIELDIEKEIDVEENKKIINLYEQTIAPITSTSAQIIYDFIDDLGYEMVEYAIQKADINNKRSMSYIKGILNNWSKSGIKTLEQAKQEELNYVQKKTHDNPKKEYNNYEQRKTENWNNFYIN